MKPRLLVLSLGLFAAASLSAQQAIKNLQLSGAENKLTSGATLSAESGSSVRVKSGGTLQLDSGATATLPNDIFTIAFVQGLQSALDGKAAASHTHTSADITDATSFTRTFLAAANASAARSSLGLGDAATLSVGTVAGTVAAGDDSRITGAVQTSRTISTTTPLAGGGALSSNLTLSIANAAADGTTKGAAAFTAADFDAASGVISLDYTNAQKASGSVPGFLSAADWSTFNAKESVLSFSSPLSRSTNAISITNAAADGTTRGAAAFTAADFDAASGVISLDYTNGQKATGSIPGFLSSTDWSTFNAKVGTTRTISTTSPLSGGGDLSTNRTLTIANSAADGTTKGAAAFTAADFDAASGVISIDYANAQKATASVPGFLTAADWSTFNGKLATNGSGASLTALNATQLTSGTVPDARFPATLPALSGVNLTNLNASNLASGTVSTSRLPTKLATIASLSTANSLLALDGSGNPYAATLAAADFTTTAGVISMSRELLNTAEEVSISFLTDPTFFALGTGAFKAFKSGGYTGIELFDSQNAGDFAGDRVYINEDGALTFKSQNGSGVVALLGGGSYNSALDFSATTGNRSYAMPDENGVLVAVNPRVANGSGTTTISAATWPVATGSPFFFHGWVRAQRTGGTAGATADAALYRVEIVGKNVGGTASVIGSSVTAIGESQSSWDVSIDASGADIRVRVTGATNNTVFWSVWGNIF